jgi:hypothetical protein
MVIVGDVCDWQALNRNKKIKSKKGIRFRRVEFNVSSSWELAIILSIIIIALPLGKPLRIVDGNSAYLSIQLTNKSPIILRFQNFNLHTRNWIALLDVLK